MSDSDISALDEITLEQALSGTFADEADTDVAQEQSAQQDEPQVQADAPTGEQADASPASETARQVPLKAYEAERDKRQAAERELAELRRTQAQQPPQKAPDPLEDPEAFARHVNEAVMRETQRLRVETQQELMRGKHPDYDEKEAKFLEMAQENPALLTQAAASGNVAKFAYETVVKAEKFAEMQDVEGYEAKLRQRLEAELRAKLEAELSARAAKAAEVDAATSLPSLATVGSGGASDAEPSLSSILGEDASRRRR